MFRVLLRKDWGSGKFLTKKTFQKQSFGTYGYRSLGTEERNKEKKRLLASPGRSCIWAKWGRFVIFPVLCLLAYGDTALES